MAEVATGAVLSLLGVIRNEWQLLRGVGGDVQFIKEEMESMNSFLSHLARTAATPGGGGEQAEDEQVRTWMNQVRLLAQDCNNCIDLYLYRGNADIHLGRGGLQRCMCWVPWFLQKLVAQHRAAGQLRELKDRARDVGERRLRYGVEVPEKVAARRSPSSGAAAAAATLAGDDIDEQVVDHHQQLVVATTDHSRLRVFPTVDDYFEDKLVEWIKVQTNSKTTTTGSSSLAVVAPNNTEADVLDNIVEHASAVATKRFGHNVVIVDIPAVHWNWGSLPRPKDTLYYIMRMFALKHKPGGTDVLDRLNIIERDDVWAIYFEKINVFGHIKEHIQEMKVNHKLEMVKKLVKEQIEQVKELDSKIKKKEKDDAMRSKISDERLPLLLVWLVNLSYQGRKKPMSTLERWYKYEDIIKEAAKKLKELIETKEETTNKAIEHTDEQQEETTTKLKQAMEEKDAKQNKVTIHLKEDRYEHILREVFHKTTTSSNKPMEAQEQDTKQEATKTTSSATNTMVEDQIKEMILKVTELLQDLQEDNSDKRQPAERQDDQVQTSDDMVKEAKEKIESIRTKIREQLKIQWMVDRIKDVHGKTALVILKTSDETMDGSIWDETRGNALSLLDCVVGTLIFTTKTSNQKAKEYCYPQSQEPLQYSLVGLYHHIVLNRTTRQEDENKCDPQILRTILDQCEPHEFCMKIFAHALHANPKRSNVELRKLHNTLQAVSPKSLVNIAKKMFKFSYDDLLKEYKSCLLYLAIFPPGRKIRRSTLIGRWVVEGLITTEDWRWSSSVDRANRCFDALIDQWLVYPADIGSTGEVKSCMVGDLVHGFITKIAMKQRIMETRLSHQLARHFSISNDLRLRSSDKIDKFLDNLSQQPQFTLLKVLDLEGCHCFGVKSKRYIKNICCKIKLLKYLSLRRTNITQLHSEINNLHELEVLDIRQTKVPAFATRDVRLLKMKRLLAGHTHPSPSNTDTGTTVEAKEFPTSVEIPEKVENMEGMEVMSNVKPRSRQDLKDIGRLWQLRKLGVVIEDRKGHLNTFLEAIRDLNDCLRSLSITVVTKGKHKATPYEGSPSDTSQYHYPKVLETLSITGTTEKVQLLTQLLLSNGSDNIQLTKVTLSKTLLTRNDLKVLAKLPKLQCVKLQHVVYNESELTFDNGEFQHLKYFLFEGSNVNHIIFVDGAAVKLEKIVLFLNDGLILSGVDKLLDLVEFELNNNNNKINNSSGTSNSSNNTAVAAIANTSTDAIATPDTDATTVATGIATTTIASDAIASASSTPNADSIASSTPTAKTATAPASTSNTATAAAAPTTNMAIADASTTIDTINPTIATKTNMFFSLLENANRITKVTLRGTMLKEDDLYILANKPTIRCLVLLDKSYAKSQLTFNKYKFPKLNLLIVERDINEIRFVEGSSPKLERLVWTFTEIKSLSGIDKLPRLKELELKGNFVNVPNEVKEAINKLKNRLYFIKYESENQDQAEGNPREADNVTKFPYVWKKSWSWRN